MFNLPVTIFLQTPTGTIPLSAGVDIDNIVKVEKIKLDNVGANDVDSYDIDERVPHTVLHLLDGRLLPIRERDYEIIQYLDAYRQLEGFFTSTPIDERPPVAVIRGGLRLVSSDTCDISEASTPA